MRCSTEADRTVQPHTCRQMELPILGDVTVRFCCFRLAAVKPADVAALTPARSTNHRIDPPMLTKANHRGVTHVEASLLLGGLERGVADEQLPTLAGEVGFRDATHRAATP